MVLLPATISQRLPKLEFLGKYREPGLLLVAGFLAGLLLFLLWLALQPATEKALTGAQSAAAGAATQKPPGDADGVLSDITGGPEVGKRGPQVQSIDDGQLAEPPLADGYDADQAFADAGADPDQPGDDGRELAGGLLDQPAAAPDDRQGAHLQTWYVEVMREPGMSEYLQVNAESAEHARAIIRDYRGDPPILRGPTTRPLD